MRCVAERERARRFVVVAGVLPREASEKRSPPGDDHVERAHGKGWIGVLRQIAGVLRVLLRGPVAQTAAVEDDLADLGIEHAREELEQRRLS